MQGLILLDGPDCAGKTTLCETIIEAARSQGFKAVRRHLGKPEKGQAWKMHAEAIVNYVEEMRRDKVVVLADRHFLSEGIYGRVYRQGSEYPYSMRFMDMLFDRVCGLKVICCPPTEKVVEVHKKMFEERHEEYKDGMDRVANMYQAVWHASRSPSSMPGTDYTSQLAALGGVQDKARWYHYDYTQHDVRGYADYLLEELRQEQALHKAMENLTFNGTAGPRSTLLIGDKMSSTNNLSLPFFANHGSSEFLAKTLHKLAIPAEELCIVNVNDPNGLFTVHNLAPLCKKIVVLGREAERTMRIARIHYHAYCRHPQHARRFNHNDDTYLNELRTAIGA